MDKQQFVIKHGESNYDISKFLKNHPGGYNYVEESRDKDITAKMINWKHSKSAFYLLREYNVGGRDKEIISEDEDLEKLVDWDKPMLSQVASLGKKYNAWVTSPVDRQLRLFGNPILENLTITPWYIVPIIWIPVVIYFIYCGSLTYMEITQTSSSILPVVLCVCLGIIIWTLLEYSLHRWVFHMEPSGSSKILIYIHFGIHGLHHKVPFDTRRLVFPPVPAAIVIYAGYYLLRFLLPHSVVLLVIAGGILGYVIYDMIHFYLHYGSPEEGTYLYTMKRYHNQHHFVHHDSGFGISNLYWDKIFGTIINLRKLAVGIRWCNEEIKLS